MSGDRDAWMALGRFTDARIAMGRSGDSLRTADILAFQADHALARDAIHLGLDVAPLVSALTPLNPEPGPIIVHSQADTRAIYLQRPDLGRKIRPDDQAKLPKSQADLAIIIGDGLSSTAVTTNALPVVTALLSELSDLTIAPVIVALQARVGLSDDIGDALGAKLAIMLIGERPGLSAADSLGAYLTYAPKPGKQNADRNCISNIRAAGLSPQEAASKIAYLTKRALNLGLSGVALKDDSVGLLTER